MDEKKSTQKMPTVAAVYSVTQTNQKNLKRNKMGLRTTYVLSTECLEDAAVQF